MQTIYKSHFCEYIFQPEAKLLKGIWTNTDEMTQDIFKEELLKGEVFSIRECKPWFYLIDTSSFSLPIAPDTQTWMAENITPNYIKYGVKKLAFLISPRFLAQLSIKQTNQEAFAMGVEKKHFEEEAKALEWLKS